MLCNLGPKTVLGRQYGHRDPCSCAGYCALQGDDEDNTSVNESDIFPEEDGIPVHVGPGGWNEVR